MCILMKMYEKFIDKERTNTGGLGQESKREKQATDWMKDKEEIDFHPEGYMGARRHRQGGTLAPPPPEML